MFKNIRTCFFADACAFFLNSCDNTISAYENPILTRNPGLPQIDLEGK